MGLVIGQIERVDHAHAGEGQAGLLGVKGDGVHGSERGQLAVEQRGHVFGGYRAIAHAHTVLLHFHQRLQPDHATASVADHLHVKPARGGLGRDGPGHLIGTKRLGGAVEGNPDLHTPASASSFAIFASSTRPTTLSSTIAAGPQAQSPRQ